MKRRTLKMPEGLCSSSVARTNVAATSLPLVAVCFRERIRRYYVFCFGRVTVARCVVGHITAPAVRCRGTFRKVIMAMSGCATGR